MYQSSEIVCRQRLMANINDVIWLSYNKSTGLGPTSSHCLTQAYTSVIQVSAPHGVEKTSPKLNYNLVSWAYAEEFGLCYITTRTFVCL